MARTAPAAYPSGVRLAYCSICRGVLSFGEVRYRRVALPRTGFTCERCGTLHHRDDRAGSIRSEALRFLIYACTAGAAASLGAAIGTRGTALGRTTGELLLWGLLALCVVCLGRAVFLGLRAADFERLTPVERLDLDRSLCPGMIRSDVVDELARRGWSIGKIRTALGELKPL